MSTRIVFNGQEYPSVDAMPAEVRSAYEEVVARLSEDKNRNGIPDIFEGGQATVGVHSSILVNGHPIGSIDDVPEPLRGMARFAIRSTLGDPSGPTGPSNPPFLERLNRVQRRLAAVLQVLSLVAAGGIIVIGSSMLRHMDASSRSQGGSVYVGIGMAVGLAWAAGMFISATRRRWQDR